MVIAVLAGAYIAGQEITGFAEAKEIYINNS